MTGDILVSQHVELWQGDLAVHLHTLHARPPGKPQVRHRVAEALYLHRAHLVVLLGSAEVLVLDRKVMVET